MWSLKYLGVPVIVSSTTLWSSSSTVFAKEPSPSLQSPNPGDVYNVPAPKCSERVADPTDLERYVNSCRKEIEPIKVGVRDSINNTASYIGDSTAAVRANVDYLRRGAPQEVQVGAIVVSALVGSMLGIRRGGIFRKLWYGSIGGAGAAALIYPEQTKVIAREGFQAAKCYGTVAYNFIVGSKFS